MEVPIIRFLEVDVRQSFKPLISWTTLSYIQGRYCLTSQVFLRKNAYWFQEQLRCQLPKWSHHYLGSFNQHNWIRLAALFGNLNWLPENPNVNIRKLGVSSRLDYQKLRPKPHDRYCGGPVEDGWIFWDAMLFAKQAWRNTSLLRKGIHQWGILHGQVVYHRGCDSYMNLQGRATHNSRDVRGEHPKCPRHTHLCGPVSAAKSPYS